MLFYVATAHAGRPFVTDDARLVERGGCQIEIFYKKQRAYNGLEFGLLPACNPSGVEYTAGFGRTEDERSLVLQAKTLLKPLQTNGSGFGFSVAALRVNPREGGNAWSPNLNGIASFSFMNDRAVVHANLGAIRHGIEHTTRPTWAISLEAQLVAPRLFGIVETYGEKAEKPTRQIGLRYVVDPKRLQVDTTLGEQRTDPARRFHTVGLRFFF